MIRQDDVSSLANDEVFPDPHALALQMIHFFDQRPRVDDHTVADDAQGPPIEVCTGYRYQGQMYRDMPADLQTLTDCEPVYKRFKGWSVSTSGATTYRSLPAEAKRYLQYIEDAAECPIDIVSTGSKREATIVLNNPLTIRSRKR